MLTDGPGAFLRRIPLHPLLFAAYAVLFLYSANLDRVLPVDAIAPLARAVAAAAGLTCVLALLIRDVRKGAIIATAIVVAYFGFGHVAGFLAGRGIGDAAQLGAWAAIVIAALVFAVRGTARVPQATFGLNLVAVVLVGVALATILPYEISRAGRGPISHAPAVRAGTDVATERDIYFLVFDRYGSADAIERRFDITDNDLYGWLVARGFQVPAHSHANYRATDIFSSAGCGTALLAPVTGTVDEVITNTWDPNVDDPATRGGNAVSIIGDDGVRYYLAHFQLIDPAITPGARVVAGDHLGEMGDTGRASACHVHFGLSLPCPNPEWWVRRGVIWPDQYLTSWRDAGNMSPLDELQAWFAEYPQACTSVESTPYPVG